MSLRIVLFGTGEFALPVFRALIESDEHSVVGVFTQPDRVGRGHHQHVNRVKALAEEHDIPVFQPAKVNATDVLDELRLLAGDVFVVAAYGQILKPEFLAIPRLGAFNLHGSLLPRHRGAAPVQYSIWKGDSDAGVTMFQIEPSLDSGPVIGMTATPICPEETSGQLMMRLADISVSLTFTALQQLDAGTAVFEPQDDSLVTLAPKIKKHDGLIDWSKSAAEIDCHIRAMQPWPRASTWLFCENRKPLRCILVEAAKTEEPGTAVPGTITQMEGRMLAGTGDGWLQIRMIQPDGKKAMDAAGFANGYGIADGSRFGSV